MGYNTYISSISLVNRYTKGESLMTLEKELLNELAFILSLDLKNKFVINEDKILLDINKNLVAGISIIIYFNNEG